MENNLQEISFTNARVAVKEQYTLDENEMRSHKIYAKLYMNSGASFDNPSFMLSSTGKSYVADMFITGKSGQIITDRRVFVNVNLDSKILKDKVNKMYFVELIHPTLNMAECEEYIPA